MTTDEPETSTSSLEPSQRTVHRDWTEYDHPTTAIVEGVAELLDTDPMEAPPLHDYVDTDALHALVTAPTDGATVTVSFTYGRVRVLVDSDGDLTLFDRPDERAQSDE